MEIINRAAISHGGNSKSAIPQLTRKRIHLESPIIKQAERIKPKSVFSSTTGKRCEKLPKKVLEESKKKISKISVKQQKAASIKQDPKRFGVNKTDLKPMNSSKETLQTKNKEAKDWLSLMKFVNDPNVAKQVVSSMIQKNHTILSSKRQKSTISVESKETKEHKIDKEILPLYEPEVHPKANSIQISKRKHDFDPNVTKTGMNLSNELLNSDNSAELKHTNSSSSSTTTNSTDVTKLKSEIYDEIKRMDMLDQFSVLKARLNSLSCLKHKINEIRAQTLSNSITEEKTGNIFGQAVTSPEQAAELIHSEDEQNKIKNPKHVDAFREKIMTKDKMVKENDSKDPKKSSVNSKNAPEYQSFVQLRGTEKPRWFPGYLEAFPNTNGIKITKTTKNTLLNAWKAVEPDNFTDLNRYVIK